MKPLQLKICGLEDAKGELAEADWQKWVGLVSCHEHPPHVTFAQYPHKYTAWLDINDLTPWECNPQQAQRLANAYHILKLTELAIALPNHARVLVHCGAGCCRSTAAAMILLVAAGWTDHAAVQKVRALKNGGGIPNGWMLKLADALFGCDLFGYCTESGNTKWTPGWMRGVPWTTKEREVQCGDC